MVAIKETSMPKYCNDCDFVIDSMGYCERANEQIPNYDFFSKTNERPNFCPLVEIEERKVGKWIGDKAYPICPKCNCNIIEEYISCTDYAEMYKPMKFCPNCGAEMEGNNEIN